MIAVTVGRRTDQIHVTFHGMGKPLCGSTETGMVAMLEYDATCEKCIKACRELITTLQACLPTRTLDFHDARM